MQHMLLKNLLPLLYQWFLDYFLLKIFLLGTENWCLVLSAWADLWTFLCPWLIPTQQNQQQTWTGDVTLYFHLASVLLLFCSRTSNFSTSFCLPAVSLLGTLKTFFATWGKKSVCALSEEGVLACYRNTFFIWNRTWYIFENSSSASFFLNPNARRFNQILLLQRMQKPSCISPWFINIQGDCKDILISCLLLQGQVLQTAYKLLGNSGAF